VVMGEVLTHRMELDQDGLWTVAMVRVTETLQGDHRPAIEVRVPGGHLRDMEISVSRAPDLVPGDQVLLFLDDDRVVGFGQGAFVVTEGKAWRSLHAWAFDNPKRLDTKAGDEAYYTWLTVTEVRAVFSRASASSGHPSSVEN